MATTMCYLCEEKALLSTFEKTSLWAHQLWVHEVWCREGVVVVPAATGPFVAFW